MDAGTSVPTYIPCSSEKKFEGLGEEVFLGPIPTSEEALKWIYLLRTFEDGQLSTEDLVKKYHNLSMAAAILSATGKGGVHQRFWSGRAMEHGERALLILEKSGRMFPAAKIEEANTRLLLAMSLNYFQNGGVTPDELADQYKNIDEGFLLENGFCRNKLLRALAKKGIIELPDYFTQVNI